MLIRIPSNQEFWGDEVSLKTLAEFVDDIKRAAQSDAAKDGNFCVDPAGLEFVIQLPTVVHPYSFFGAVNPESIEGQLIALAFDMWAGFDPDEAAAESADRAAAAALGNDTEAEVPLGESEFDVPMYAISYTTRGNDGETPLDFSHVCEDHYGALLGDVSTNVVRAVEVDGVFQCFVCENTRKHLAESTSVPLQVVHFSFPGEDEQVVMLCELHLDHFMDSDIQPKINGMSGGIHGACQQCSGVWEGLVEPDGEAAE